MDDPASQRLKRLKSGVPGLDTILRGGFIPGGTYIVMGTPGTGKTILGNQVAFNQVASGGRAVYVTLLTESHAGMFEHLRSLSFFNESAIGDRLIYVSGYHELDQNGLQGLLDLLRRVIQDSQASMLVLDGLVIAELFADSPLAFKRFVHGLQIYTEISGCTTILLTHRSDERPYTGHAMADGLIELLHQRVGPRTVREIEVRKFRGSGYLQGLHTFDIKDEGVVIYPRTEALLSDPSLLSTQPPTWRGFGVPRLDEMLNGGVLSNSTTMLLGAPGSGKTSLGLHFLSTGANEGQTGLYFGFRETPAQLASKARNLGLDFDKHIRKGRMVVQWQLPVEGNLDALAEKLLAIVEQRNIQRLFIDDVSGFREAAIYPERIDRIFTALGNSMSTRNITTLFAVQTPDILSPSINAPSGGVTGIGDNIILLRYVELRSQLYRLISIVKMRESAYDPAIREFKITERGIDVAATFESAEGILTGVARPAAGGASSIQDSD